MKKDTLMPYSIYAEQTPNPNTMKFVANRWLSIENQSFEILRNQPTEHSSPLVNQLFQFPFITGVFISANYITLTKSEVVEWIDVMVELREFITNYLNTKGMVVVHEKDSTIDQPLSEIAQKEEIEPQKEYTEFEKKIADILDEYIKPAVESDGGAIVLDSYQEGIVKVILQGACSGCPSSTMTLKRNFLSKITINSI